MRQFIVTFKLPRNKDHDPANKVTGTCPVTGKICTDVTGAHHSGLYELIDSATPEGLRAHLVGLGLHVTRIEEV